ncbi:hypothetical protein HBI16_085830 [Parastagonospora nodorum]|nr:hypothetical protein HBI16_085830 [Parastagonospora nodorum]
MLQTNVREGYRITTLEVVKLIEDLISYLAVAKCIRLQNAQIPKVFYEAAYSAKVKIEDLSNMLMLTLSKTAQRRSSSVVSNRSTALITDKFGVASLTEPAILNNANVALVDAVHYSVQKLEENYFKVRAQHLKYNVIDALTMTLIKNDDDLLGTVNSYIKPPLKRCKTEAADSRYAKASGGRTKKDKDSEDSNTSSDVLRSRRRDRVAACAQLAERKHLLDSDDYCLDSSLDINSKNNLEDEEATTAKDLAREQKERLKALLNAKTRDSLSARVETAIEHYTLEEQNASDKVQNAQAEGNAIEYNAVNDNDKLYPTKGERTFYCADPLALQFCFFSNSPLENIGRLTKEEAIEMRINTTNAISKALAAANKDILEKEGLDKSEASRRVIFNRFKMQAIASYPALATLKAAQFKTYSSCKVKRFTLNSVKDLFTNLSKDYFLVRKARAITKSSLKFQNLSNLYSKSIAAEDAAKAANTLLPPKEVRAKILIELYKPIKFSDESILVMQRGMTQHEINLKLLAEMCVSIIYFNLDSELELKVLGKQDVKTTS